MASSRKHTLLLVEDDDWSMEMLRRRLERQGYRVIEARNGDAVQPLLTQIRPDLILLDLHLPGLDGWSLAGLLKAHPQQRTIPLIAVTADAMAGDREKALQAGCDAYLTKPIDFVLLLEIIQKQLTKKGLRPLEHAPDMPLLGLPDFPCNPISEPPKHRQQADS